MSDWKTASVSPEATVREVIAKLNERGGRTVLIVREERLLGTVTDGDIRRAILAGIALEAPITGAMNATPKTVRSTQTRAQIRTELKRLEVRHLPIVDVEGRLVGLAEAEEEEKPEWRQNWVLIMAGGRGTRLAPLTERTPKPMLEVGSKPLLETIVETLKAHRFRRIMLAVHYRAEMVEEYFGDGSRHDVQIEYLHEPEPRGTAGALAMMSGKVDAPVLVMNGDLLTTLNFDRMLTYHREKASAVTMAVREYSSQVPFGVVRLDDDRVCALEEKPMQRCIVNAGVYVVEPRVIPPTGEGYLDMPTFITGLLEQGEPVSAFPIHEYWRDIGRVEDLALASNEYRHVFE